MFFLYKYKCSFYFRRNMHKQQSSVSLSRSASSRSLHRKQPIGFQTILKRRNDTIAASQLYETPPSSKSSRILSRSSFIQKEIPKEPEPSRQNIKEYVKKMAVKKVDLESKPQPRPCPTVEEHLNRKSSHSNRSSCSSVAMQLKPVEVKPSRSIEELQAKIESLIKSSIQLLKKQKSSIGLVKWSQNRKSSSLDQDFKQITEYFNDLKLQVEENDIPQEKMSDLIKKIQLLERMLASQSAESDILKHQYYNWKNQRGNTSSFSCKKLLADTSRFNRQTRGLFNSRKENSNQGSKHKEAVTRFNSTSKIFFTKPSKEYYLSPKPKNNSYCLNRQPMPRSSYSTQYLNYGHIPTYTYKADEVAPFPDASLAVKASTYQQEYKEKLNMTKNIDIRQLDCTRDKFKNPNMSFMANCKKTSPQATSNLKKVHKDYCNSISSKQNFNSCQKRYDPSLIACMSMTSSANFYKSEHDKEYVWHNYVQNDDGTEKDEILKSQIKDKKLQKMKDTFKALAMRN